MGQLRRIERDGQDLELDRCDDEPSVGWCEGMANGQGRWGGVDDRELDEADREPELG